MIPLINSQDEAIIRKQPAYRSPIIEGSEQSMEDYQRKTLAVTLNVQVHGTAGTFIEPAPLFNRLPNRILS